MNNIKRISYIRDIGFVDSSDGEYVLFSDLPNKLTIEELREQFENHYARKEKLKWFGDRYGGSIQDDWFSYLQCARSNNILKDGE